MNAAAAENAAADNIDNSEVETTSSPVATRPNRNYYDYEENYEINEAFMFNGKSSVCNEPTVYL